MKLKTKELTICGLFAALIAVGAFLKVNIPMPLYTMHFTLQWLFVLLAGYLLGAKAATVSVGVYLLIGLAGVPVFAAGGGPAYLIRPTFGFLLGFLFAVFCIGYLTERFKCSSFLKMILPGTVGLVIYYGCGMVYFYMINRFLTLTPVGWKVVFVDYCLITLFPDFLLVVIAAGLASRLKPVFTKMYTDLS